MGNVSLIIGLTLLVLFVLILSISIFEVRKIRRKSIDEIVNGKMSYFNVVAGNCNHIVSEKSDSISCAVSDFKDKNGNKIDSESFDKYVVVGESMKLCGIHDKDLLFVDKNYKDSLSSLPKVLVMEISKAKENEVKYKVRRAWRVCNINDNLDNLIKEIQNNPKFAALKESEHYSNDELMIKDFHEELEKYREEFLTNGESKDYSEIVISTTIRDDKIHFSIHPLQLVVGVVRHSFDTNVNSK